MCEDAAHVVLFGGLHRGVLILEHLMQGLEAPELDLRVLADREPRQAELEAVGALLDVIQEGGHLLLEGGTHGAGLVKTE